jgi:hypothetical protein
MTLARDYGTQAVTAELDEDDRLEMIRQRLAAQAAARELTECAAVQRAELYSTGSMNSLRVGLGMSIRHWLGPAASNQVRGAPKRYGPPRGLSTMTDTVTPTTSIRPGPTFSPFTVTAT